MPIVTLIFHLLVMETCLSDLLTLHQFIMAKYSDTSTCLILKQKNMFKKSVQNTFWGDFKERMTL